MLSTTEIFNRLNEYFNEEAAQAITSAITDTYGRLAEKLTDFEKLATKDEVNELRDAIKQLTEAQSKTEVRLDQLAESQIQLAEAQSRTEEKLNQLVEAQKRTEGRLNQLAEAQKRTEERLNQLAEAQSKTERELAKLTIVVGRVHKNFGGLSDSIGFMLEDRAFKALPALLKERFGIEVQGRLIRTYLENAQGESEEVNIYGKGLKDGSELVIVGESKSQLAGKHITRFKKMLARLTPVLGMEVFPLMTTYMAKPEVLQQAETENIAVFMSYEF